ncbi:hypothetical protein Q7P37_002601 [Cladosporium fusiforme]
MSQNHNTYLPGYTQIKHHEWRTAENSAQYLLPTLTSLATSNPSLKFLDVGAGPGTLTTSFAKYLPEGHITAVDLSSEVLARAAQHASSAGVQNITFQPASIYSLSETFGPNSFDVVHVQQVLCHLDSPVQALAEMLKVVKPGGVVAVREIDMRCWSFYPPESEVMNDWIRVQLATLQAAGGNAAAGPSLVSWAMKAGASREDITASMGTWMYSTPEERQIWGSTFRDRITGGEMRKKALELGISTEAELDRMGEEWQRWIDTEDACCGTIHGEILVRKAA